MCRAARRLVGWERCWGWLRVIAAVMISAAASASAAVSTAWCARARLATRISSRAPAWSPLPNEGDWRGCAGRSSSNAAQEAEAYDLELSRPVNRGITAPTLLWAVHECLRMQRAARSMSVLAGWKIWQPMRAEKKSAMRPLPYAAQGTELRVRSASSRPWAR